MSLHRQPCSEEQKSEIKRIISESFGTEVTDNSLLFQDIGAAGLDCLVFLEDFAERYDLDMQAFDFNRYCAEGLSGVGLKGCLLFLFAWPFFLLKILLQSKSTHRLDHVFPVSHLYAVVEKGCWFEPSPPFSAA